MHFVRIALVCLAVLAVGACATRVAVPSWSSLQQQIEERLVDATEAPLMVDERSVLQSALAHAHPESPIYDRELAQERLNGLIERYPRSAHATFAGYLLPLLAEVDGWERRYAEAESEALEQRLQTEELETRLVTVDEARRDAAREASGYREQVQRLTEEIRTRDERIQELETTLQRLMNIDLRPSE